MSEPRGEREAAPSDGALGEVRSELRRLGYLDHRVERFLLQDALRPERPLPLLAGLAAKVGLLVGFPAALASTFVLAAVNGHLHSSPADLVPLFVHLFPPLVLGAAAAFLALGGALAVFLRFSPVRRIEALSSGLAVAAGAGLALAGLSSLRSTLEDASWWQLAALIVGAPLVAWAGFRIVHGGLLALAIRLTGARPERRGLSGLGVAVAVALAALLLTLPTVLDLPGPPGPAASFPSTPGARAVLIGVDGVRPDELAYLLARGELPRIAGLLAGGGAAMARYRRPEGPPASLWTTIATGVPPALHGLDSLDAFRPRGLARPLAWSGWLRPWWARVEAPLGLAEYRPVLAAARRAYAFWELAARGGEPVLVVDWWGTYPAEPVPGLVLAHGGYQLLANGAPGVVEPAGATAEVTARRAAARADEVAAALVASLGEAAAREVLDKAVLPDAFYRDLFAERLGAAPRAAALYLPALDLVAVDADVGAVAFADLVGWQLAAVDELVDRAAAEAGTVVVVLDPGRRGGDEGRVLVWRREGCEGGEEPLLVAPGAVAASLLRALGLPQSREVPPPVPLCPWPEPSLFLETYGPRDVPDPTTRGDEYLESLRSLGYL